MRERWRQELRALGRAGLTRPPIPVACFDDEPSFPSYIVYAATDSAAAAGCCDDPEEYEPPSGFGIAQEDLQAQMKAAGECLENLCALDYRGEHIGTLKSPAPDQSRDAARMRDALAQSYCDHEGEADALAGELCWPIRNPVTGELAAWPAALISLAPEFACTRAPHVERTSAGLAAGALGTQGALRGGLLEQIERDALAAAFSDPGRLRWFGDLPAAASRLVAQVEAHGLKLHLLDVSSDLRVPTALCLAIDETGRGPFLSAGAAAAFDLSSALEKAILESVQGRSVLRAAADDILGRGEPATISDGLDRVAYWWDIARAAELEALLAYAAEPAASPAVSIDNLDSLLAFMRSRSLDVWVADLSLPAVRSAGFEVVRVITPALHMLHSSEANRQSFSRHYGRLGSSPDVPPHPFA